LLHSQNLDPSYIKFDSIQDQLIPMLGDSHFFLKITIRVNSYKTLGEPTRLLNFILFFHLYTQQRVQIKQKLKNLIIFNYNGSHQLENNCVSGPILYWSQKPQTSRVGGMFPTLDHNTTIVGGRLKMFISSSYIAIVDYYHVYIK
jgi:hypothetical protein